MRDRETQWKQQDCLQVLQSYKKKGNIPVKNRRHVEKQRNGERKRNKKNTQKGGGSVSHSTLGP